MKLIFAPFTEIGWGDVVPFYEKSSRSTTERDDLIPIATGDFDGDGYSEILEKNYYQLTLRNLKSGDVDSYTNVSAASNIKSCAFIDIDGDGCEELIFHYQEQSHNFYPSYVFYVKYDPNVENNLKNIIASRSNILTEFHGTFKDPQKIHFLPVPSKTAIYNDLLVVLEDKSCRRIDVKNKETKEKFTIESGRSSIKDIQMIDLYSNGEYQYLWKDENNTWHFHNTPAGKPRPRFQGYSTASIVDLNMDGQQDIIFFYPDGIGHCYQNNYGDLVKMPVNLHADLFIDKPSLGLTNATITERNLLSCHIVPLDYNFDGHPEYLVSSKLEIKSPSVNSGRKFSLNNLVLIEFKDGKWNKYIGFEQHKNKYIEFAFGRFISGTGTDIYMREVKDGSGDKEYTLFSRKLEANNPLQISYIQQRGVKECRFSYQITMPPRNPEQRRVSLTDCAVLRNGIITVNSLYGKNEEGTYTTKNYTFEKGIVHTQGMGLLGFSSIQCVDDVIGVSTVTNTFGFGRIPYLKIQDTRTQSMRNEQTFDLVSLSDKYPIHASLLTNQFVRTLSDYSWTASNYSYDNQLRLTLERTNTKDNICSTRQFLDYNERKQPRREITNIKYPSSSSEFTKETHYAYSPQGVVKQKSERANTNTPVTSSYEYNNIGQLIRQTTSAPGVETVVTEYSFCPRTLRLLNEKTALSETQYEYYPYTGLLLNKTVIKGAHSFKTDYRYDSWGNLIYERNPFGRETTISYGWGSADGKKTAYYHSIRRTSGLADVIQGYDCNGRVIFTSSEVGDVNIQQYKGYDMRGRVALEATSNSFLEKWEETSYDK